MSRETVAKIAKKYSGKVRNRKLMVVCIVVLMVSSLGTYFLETYFFPSLISITLVISVLLTLLSILAGPSSVRGFLISCLLLGIVIGTSVSGAMELYHVWTRP
jgi:hypothetical protein